MIGIVQEFGTTHKGSQKVKIGGQWYFAGKCDISDMKTGDKIDFESSKFGDKQQFNGLNNWAKAAEPTAVTKTNGATPPADGAVRPEWLSFLSNTVAHAITQGLIKQPSDLGPWVIAGRLALESKPVRGSPDEPEFEERVPF